MMDTTAPIKPDINIESDVLAMNDINLLALAFTWATPEETAILLNYIKQATNLDLTDPVVIHNLDDAQVDKLQKFETSHKSFLLAIIFRQHDAELQEQDKVVFKRRSLGFIRIFGSILIFFALIYIAAITWIPIPADNVRFADTCLGFLLGTVVSTIINFFFGSSMSRRLDVDNKNNPNTGAEDYDDVPPEEKN